MYYNMRLTKNYGIILDAPVHFTNVSPVTPSAPLTAEDMYASSFNAWVYSTLYCNKLFLPLCDKIFPEGRPDFNRIQAGSFFCGGGGVLFSVFVFISFISVFSCFHQNFMTFFPVTFFSFSSDLCLWWLSCKFHIISYLHITMHIIFVKKNLAHCHLVHLICFNHLCIVFCIQQNLHWVILCLQIQQWKKQNILCVNFSCYFFFSFYYGELLIRFITFFC